MQKAETSNTFGDGLVMDTNPLVTPNNVLSNALNATLLTFNGNELVLQNDMGNGRVETAYLPEGYVPLGTAELGGIIYIVSYNPLIDKCQIGSFPSPERNITSSEIQAPQVNVTNEQFQATDGKLVNVILKVKLLSDPNSEDGLYKLNPGDKYTIYSTNSGISNNSKQISDVGNKLHQVDTDPRNVTIHVVSIGEDGKIVYLDDSLKWDSKKPADYYIKECSGKEAVSTDIDSYRSLVSSAYNIFNSKVSGELALLFELKIIDTFSVTWDAEVEGEDSEKTAKIKFNINYTSDHEKINLKHIILTESDVIGSLTCPRNKCDHCTLDDQSGRKNDGTDKDIVVEVGDFKYNSDNKLSDYIWNYELTPAMSFGYLEFLAQRGSINFSEIGSGKTEIDEWRYYIQDTNFYLNWGLSAYPEKNKKIDRVIMTFIPFEAVSSSTVITDKTQPPSTSYPQYTITGKNSYSGYFQELINFGESSKVANGTIIKNYLYLVDTCIQYGKEDSWEYRHNYKWIYTTGQWNEIFQKGEILDFNKELTLDDVLTFESKFSTKDNIDKYKSEYDSKVEFPRTLEGKTQPYIVMGAQVTTVSYEYDEKTAKFNETNPCIAADVKTECTSYPELFKFEKQSGDKYNFEIKETSISHDDFKPTSTKASVVQDSVIPKIKEAEEGSEEKPKTDIAADFASTIKDIIEKGIESEDVDNKAIDSFTAQIKQNSGNDSHIDINVRGALFARINAALEMKQVLIQQEIRPFLLYDTDYETLGLEHDKTQFQIYYTEKHFDGGKNIKFSFKNRSESYSYQNSNDDWGDNKPGDTFDKQNWWDLPPFVDHFFPEFMSSGVPFICTKWDGEKDTFWGTSNHSVNQQCSLWVRTTEDHYLPINAWDKTESKLYNQVKALYATLYYVDTNEQFKNMPIVSAICYMTNYSETWTIVIKTSLSISDINRSVFLTTTQNENKSLKSLQDICNGITLNGEKVIEVKNITRNTLPTLEVPDYTISHVFIIRNIQLYDTYSEYSLTTIPAIMSIISEENWQRCNPKNQGMLFVYNEEAKELVRATKDVYRWLYESVTFTEIDSEIPDVKRLKLTGGQHTKQSATHGTQPQLAAMTVNKDNILVANESKILNAKAQMILSIESHGHEWSYVRNNSAYTLPNVYSGI